MSADTMTTALIRSSADGREDTPVCAACMPYVGNHAPYIPDPSNAPVCVVDEKDPRFCRCPECHTEYRTPVHHVLGILLARLK